MQICPNYLYSKLFELITIVIKDERKMKWGLTNENGMPLSV